MVPVGDQPDSRAERLSIGLDSAPVNNVMEAVGVAGRVIEVGLPLSVIEFPETLTSSHGEVVNCCADPVITQHAHA